MKSHTQTVGGQGGQAGGGGQEPGEQGVGHAREAGNKRVGRQVKKVTGSRRNRNLCWGSKGGKGSWWGTLAGHQVHPISAKKGPPGYRLCHQVAYCMSLS